MKEVSKKRGRPVGYKKAVECQCKQIANLSSKIKSMERGINLFIELTNKTLDVHLDKINNLQQSTNSTHKEANESKIFCRTVREWMVKKGWLNPLE